MKKIIYHLSSRYSSFGTFLASKKFFKFSENKIYKNYYLTGRIDNSDFNKKETKVKFLNLENNIFFYKLNNLIERSINFIIQKKITKLYWSNSLMNFSFLDKIKKIKKADLIIIYWINDNFLTLKDIERILDLNIPVIWRFSDMWPFTGGCHYSYDCNLYQVGCRNCPQLSKFKIFDLASYVFSKKKLWKTNNLTIISPSSEMKQKIETSPILKGAKVLKVLNGVDVDFFQFKKQITNSKLKILVGPFGKSDYERKGYYHFIKILEHFKELNNIDIDFEIFGGLKTNKKSSHNLNIYNHGFIDDREKLKKLYQKNDVYLFLSNQDNSPNTVAESLSCGTPILTFKDNGTSDFCINGYNSFIFDKFDIKQICNMIIKLNEDKQLLKKISVNARNYAVDELDLKLTKQKFRLIVKELLDENCQY